MSRHNDWATSHRNSRGVFAVIGLIGVLVWALVLKKQEESHTLLRTDQITATISQIKITKREGDSRTSGATYFVQLELPDKKHIRFMLLRQPPKVGTQVPVLVDIYDDDKKYYHYSLVEWSLL